MAAQDSLQIIIKRIDSLRIVTNNLNESHQVLSAKIDSVRYMTSNMLIGQSETAQQIDSIGAQLKTISEYGIGFSDAAGHIALPLIIALFAFALPFIFSAINHINNKYSSRVLSELFVVAFRYKLFWFVNIGSIILALAYGACSLLMKDASHKMLLNMSWILIIIAIFYAFSMVSFVIYCIRFNKPSKLIDIIRLRYKRETRIENRKERVRRLKDWIRRKLKKINQGNNDVYGLFRRIGRNSSYTAVEYIRIDRLVALCQYAMRNNDINLFDEIIYEIDKVAEEDNKRYADERVFIISTSHPFCSSRFYDAIYAFYAQCPVNEHIDERLVRYRLKTFSKRRLVSDPGLNWLLTSMMRMGDVHRITLIERYIKESLWHFKFVRKLAQSVYVQGGSKEDRLKAEKESRKNWDVVCNYHLVMMAYCFGQGNYSLLKAIKKRRLYDDDLYPTYSTEILLRYLKCKNSFHYDGYFEVYDTVDMIHKKIEGETVSRFAAALLLLSEPEQFCAEVLTKKQKEFLEPSIKELKKQAETLKSDTVFIRLYPEVAIKNVDDILKKCLENVSEENEKKLFGDEINNMVEERLNNYVQNIGDSVRRGVGDKLFGYECSDFTEIEVNECPIITHRLVFTNLDEDYLRQIAHFIDETITARVLHILLSILKEKRVKIRKSTPVDFSRCLRKITGGDTKKYIIIDADSGFSSSLMPKVVGAGFFDYQGYTLYKLDQWRTSLNETALMDDFRGSLWLVEKSLLPILKRANDKAKPTLKAQDESSQAEGKLDVRITVNPNLKLCYRNRGMIYQIKPQKVKL